MNQALIQQARQANLAEYLLSVGEPLIKNGNRYRHAKHDSLIFTENAYFWNSQQEHGNAVDYLTKHMNMAFPSAILALTKRKSATRSNEWTKTEFEQDYLSINYDDDSIVKQYLHKIRKIGYNSIIYLVNNKLLFQEEETNNAIFPIYDENNILVGAELHGTLAGKRFKGRQSGSKYGYGFNLKLSNNNTFDYALFFESAVDLLSFIDYKRNKERKSLKRCILVSMGGLKLNVIHHTLQAFKGNLKVVLCVDNDKAGQKFKDSVKEENISFIDRSPDENFKDWNEQIKAQRSRKPISRLIENEQEKFLPSKKHFLKILRLKYHNQKLYLFSGGILA